MSQEPFHCASGLCIGSVEFVSPDEIKVSLDIEAPESVALNTGGPRAFPRVNNYVLVGVDDGFMVGQIEWLTVERSAFPKRRGMVDFGLVDLPYPLRKMSLNPVGTLRAGDAGGYSFRRGTEALPSVGSSVLLPTEEQLKSIIESGERRRVKIGTSPLAGDAEVRVDPDRLFGRHLAVLGNTGSGKSCSVAGLIRWSLEQAARESGSPPNARFVILDPNGEYSRAFSPNDKDLQSRVFKVDPGTEEKPLQVPLWLWNSAEWCSFSQASAKTQRPLLQRALREVRAGRTSCALESDEEKKLRLRRYLSSTFVSIRADLLSGAIKTDESKFGSRLAAILSDLESKKALRIVCNLPAIQVAIQEALNETYHEFQEKRTNEIVKFYRAFTEAQVENILEELAVALSMLGGLLYQEGPNEDMPLAFDGVDLADHLQILAEQENVTQFLDFLISRIRAFLSDPRMKAVVGDAESIGLEEWLGNYLGSADLSSGPVVVIDLSLVPTEIVHVVAAVVSRIVFESLQRYVKINKVPLPTVLVMEEAHTFVRRYRDDADSQDAASICCRVFERIAREGRKFGLGLVLSSQRPSELSPTVISQCNSFLLHRISNDRDQDLVHRLVPDNLKGLLRELPSLPSQSAILVGWASELPMLVKMNYLPKSQQPRSEDPDFWAVWTGKDERGEKVERPANWGPVVEDWQGASRIGGTEATSATAEGGAAGPIAEGE